jgi:hypothetical protein
MNTLEMAIELRKNPKLKAKCKVGDVIWKVKCINGSIMWDDDTRKPEFLQMDDCILRRNYWDIYEENKTIELFHHMEIELDKGIGELPKNKKIIGDIYVQTSDEKVQTIRPIGNMFAVPTNDNKVEVYFKYESICDYYVVKGSGIHTIFVG